MHIINADHTLQNSKMTSKFLEALGINEDALIGLDHTLQNSKMTSKFLEALGINEDALIGLEDLPCLACHRDLLSNGAIVELLLSYGVTTQFSTQY